MNTDRAHLYSAGVRRLHRRTKNDLLRVVTLNIGYAAMHLHQAHRCLEYLRVAPDAGCMASLRRQYLTDFRSGIRALLVTLGREEWPAIRSLLRYHLRCHRPLPAVATPLQEAA